MHSEDIKIIRMEVALGSFTLVCTCMRVCVPDIPSAVLWCFITRRNLFVICCLWFVYAFCIRTHLTCKESFVTFCPNLPHISLSFQWLKFICTRIKITGKNKICSTILTQTIRKALRCGHISKPLAGLLQELFCSLSSVAINEVTFKSSRFLLVNMTDSCDQLFRDHTKLLIMWIPIEMTGFRLWNFAEQLWKCHHTLSVKVLSIGEFLQTKPATIRNFPMHTYFAVGSESEKWLLCVMFHVLLHYGQYTVDLLCLNTFVKKKKT